MEQFGGIDIVVNNASAIDLTPTEQMRMKRYDLMQDINARGTFLLSEAAIPHLRHSANPHVPHAVAADPPRREVVHGGASRLQHRRSTR